MTDQPMDDVMNMPEPTIEELSPDDAAGFQLAYTFRWDPPDPDDRETLVALSLSEDDGRTAIELMQGEFATQARLALHKDGWTDCFERLEELTQFFAVRKLRFGENVESAVDEDPATAAFLAFQTPLA